MDTDVWVALIAAAGAVLVAGASYWFTKRGERDAELRKEKLEHYKEFTTCLSGIISGEATASTQRAFSLSCNKLNLIAPQSLVEALQEFQDEIRITNPARSQEQHDELLSVLFYEIRKDLGIASDKEASFRVRLWASGTSNNDG